MRNDQVQHIGGDQLISGLPKHMEAVAGDENITYLEIVPGKDACATCRTMRGMRFAKKPTPVHPNCTCEVRRVARPLFYYKSGSLEGFRDSAFVSFGANQIVSVEFRHQGPFPSGVDIWIDQMSWESTGQMFPGQVKHFSFSKFGEPPVIWEFFFLYQGFDNSIIDFIIRS